MTKTKDYIWMIYFFFCLSIMLAGGLMGYMIGHQRGYSEAEEDYLPLLLESMNNTDMAVDVAKEFQTISYRWMDTAKCERENCKQILENVGVVGYSSFCGQEEIVPNLNVSWAYWKEVD